MYAKKYVFEILLTMASLFARGHMYVYHVLLSADVPGESHTDSFTLSPPDGSSEALSRDFAPKPGRKS
jgi:hypothetical protein